MVKWDIFSKAEKMELIAKIYLGEPILNDNSFLLFELEDEGSILPDDLGCHLTYFGIYQLENWDPILRVSIDDQALRIPYGYA